MTPRGTGTTLTIAANQGIMGGGEVMLFAIAEAARELGRAVTVVAPAEPADVAVEARRRGFAVVAIDGASTVTYLRNLRRWDARHRRGLLWCNGLRPGFATAGHPDRVVELHQRPEGALRALAKVATRGARAVVVPSHDMANDIPGSRVLWNWSDPVDIQRLAPRPDTTTVGFLGRLSSDKGVVVLAEAMQLLEHRAPGRFRLLLAGESRFVAGDDVRRVEAALQPLGAQLDRRGWMSRDAFFSDVDLAVFPSVWAEPFGLVVSEAMAAGVPFVISDAGALQEVAGDAFVAMAGDARSLADAIEAASLDPERHIQAARRRWEEQFSPAAGRTRLEALLSELDPPQHIRTPRVVLAHDYLTQRGGAERVALTLMQGFPGSTLITSVHDARGTYPEFTELPVRTTWLQHVPLLRKHFRVGLALYGPAFSTTNVGEDADVVLCSSTGFAHGIRSSVPKIVYCHSPARFLYLIEDYLGGPWWRSPVGWALMAMRPLLVAWDQRAAKSADAYLANSSVVAERIKTVYGIDADVVFPPHAIDPSGAQEPISGAERPFHLVVSRLMPYKNVDVVIEAFRAMPQRHLLIIGRGPLGEELRACKPANVTMVEGLSDAQMRWAYANAEAVIAPSREDFGLTPVEGFAFGTPTLALRAGGYLDTVLEGVSGWFFDEVSPRDIQEAVERLERAPLDETGILRHAEQFSVAAFLAAIEEKIEEITR